MPVQAAISSTVEYMRVLAVEHTPLIQIKDWPAPLAVAASAAIYAQLLSPTARLKLAGRTLPYFVKVARGAWLGYRKPFSGPGSWAARDGFSDGKGWEKTLWGADDNGLKPDGDKVLSFWQAKEKVQNLVGRKLDADILTVAADDGAPITLDKALTDYANALKERGASVRNVAIPRYNLSDTMLSKPVSLVTEAELKGWRSELLTKGLAPSSVNRNMNSLRAALTLADKTRVHIWRGGLKALPDATETNKVVIEDEATAQVGRGKLRPRSPARVVDACAR